MQGLGLEFGFSCLYVIAEGDGGKPRSPRDGPAVIAWKSAAGSIAKEIGVGETIASDDLETQILNPYRLTSTNIHMHPTNMTISVRSWFDGGRICPK